MTGLPYVIETALLLLVAFLVGCGLGYGLRRLSPRRRSRPAAPPVSPETTTANAQAQSDSAPPVTAVEQKVASPAAAAAAPAAAASTTRTPADPRPAALAAPHGGVKDDLKQIKGIGPRIEMSLNELGIFHFSQIARWSKRNVAWIDQRLSFKGRIERENWIEQAKTLAKTSTPPVRKRDRSGP